MSEENSKQVSYVVLASGQEEVSKVNSYVVLVSEEVQVSKMISYVILSPAIAPQQTILMVMT